MVSAGEKMGVKNRAVLGVSQIWICACILSDARLQHVLGYIAKKDSALLLIDSKRVENLLKLCRQADLTTMVKYGGAVRQIEEAIRRRSANI